MERVAVYRRVTFNSAHRLYRKDWSDEKNAEVFGLCANPNFHGHNYTLIVKVTGEIDQETGYVIDIKDLKKIIAENITDVFDHSNLNEDIPAFKTLIPTGENIIVVIYNLIREKLDKKYDLSIKLYETDRNFFKYPA